MQNIEELQAGCADMLRRLRLETGATKEQMADGLDVDKKTYLKYEAGTSAPSVPAFISLFSSLGKDALRTVLDYIYPDVYHGLDASSDPAAIRAAAVHYFQSVASDHEIRAISFLIFGGHGSNWFPQLEEFVALDHLPLESRLMVANLIDDLYALSAKLDRLIGTDHVMPDMQIFHDGIDSGREAAYSGRNSYTTSAK